MTVAVAALADKDLADWDRFVRSHPEGTFCHLSAWKPVIEQAFGHRTHYLVARRGAAICGVLPLTYIRSPLFGNRLISNAFCVYGGPLAEDAAARTALEAEARRIAEDLRVEFLEFRLQSPANSDWVRQNDLYVTFRMPLAGSAEENMKALPSKQRNMIRKGIGKGLVSVKQPTVDTMYQVYAESVRNLGTPVFSRKFFRLLKRHFGDDCEVITIYDGDTPVATAMNFYFRDEVTPYYAGGTHAARDIAGNDFMFWESMRHGWERGAKIYDFGRSKIGTGSFSFKQKWGLKPIPLYVEYLPVMKKEIQQINPLNPKFSAMIATWKRLPLPVANLIGPHIVRQTG